MGPPGCFPREAQGMLPAGGGKQHCRGRSGPLMDQDGSSMPSHRPLSDLVREEGNALWYLGHCYAALSQIQPQWTQPNASWLSLPSGYRLPFFIQICCSLVSLVSFFHLMAPITQTHTCTDTYTQHTPAQRHTHTHAQIQQLTPVFFLSPPIIRSPPHTLYF